MLSQLSQLSQLLNLKRMHPTANNLPSGYVPQALAPPYLQLLNFGKMQM
jgi:hypothetical protein